MKASYIKTQLQTLINISKIVTIHYFEFDQSFSFAGERHDFWEMVYVDRGCVQIRSDERESTLSQGEIVFHRPNEFHAIRALDSSPNFFVVSFVCNSPAMQYFEGFQTKLDGMLKGFISSVIEESENTYEIPKNDPLLKQLKRREDAAVGGEQLIKTYLEQLLIFLIRGITKKGENKLFPTKESMEGHLVTAVKELINAHGEAPLHVSEICRTLGYSKSYLSKLFRTQTGETIAHYATTVKMKRAKHLIRDGHLNFAQISDRLGFDNPQYFSFVFKRQTGMTPTEFKQSLRFKG